MSHRIGEEDPVAEEEGPVVAPADVAEEESPVAAPADPDEDNDEPRRMNRRTRACDICNGRGIRCAEVKDKIGRCQNCKRFRVNCTFKRAMKKRGVRGANDISPSNWEELLPYLDSHPKAWQFMAEVSENKITECIELYLLCVYPVFPLHLVHDLREQTKNKAYLYDAGSFAETMAICALVSAKIRDKAILMERYDPALFADPSPEQYSDAARHTLLRESSEKRGIDWMRAYAFMTLYGLQVGDTDIMHAAMGEYNILIAMDGLKDEKNWPEDLSADEIEMRKRVFWTMYAFETCSSIISDDIHHVPISRINVELPAIVGDQELLNRREKRMNPKAKISFESDAGSDEAGWLHGWNCNIQLHRILEQGLDRMRSTRKPSRSGGRVIEGSQTILGRANSLHDNLPGQFKKAYLYNPRTGTSADVKVKYQAASIAVTMQLIHMVHLVCEGQSIDSGHEVITELSTILDQIPGEYVAMLSSPMLDQILAIGSTIGFPLKTETTEGLFETIRQGLCDLAELPIVVTAALSYHSHGIAEQLKSLIKEADVRNADMVAAASSIQAHKRPDKKARKKVQSGSQSMSASSRRPQVPLAPKIGPLSSPSSSDEANPLSGSWEVANDSPEDMFHADGARNIDPRLRAMESSESGLVDEPIFSPQSQRQYQSQVQPHPNQQYIYAAQNFHGQPSVEQNFYTAQSFYGQPGLEQHPYPVQHFQGQPVSALYQYAVQNMQGQPSPEQHSYAVQNIQGHPNHAVDGIYHTDMLSSMDVLMNDANVPNGFMGQPGYEMTGAPGPSSMDDAHSTGFASMGGNSMQRNFSDSSINRGVDNMTLGHRHANSHSNQRATHGGPIVSTNHNRRHTSMNSAPNRASTMPTTNASRKRDHTGAERATSGASAMPNDIHRSSDHQLDANNTTSGASMVAMNNVPREGAHYHSVANNTRNGASMAPRNNAPKRRANHDSGMSNTTNVASMTSMPMHNDRRESGPYHTGVNSGINEGMPAQMIPRGYLSGQNGHSDLNGGSQANGSLQELDDEWDTDFPNFTRP